MTSLVPSLDAPAIDPEAIRTYCTVLFGYLEGLVPVRFLAEKGTPPQKPRQEFLSPDRLSDRLIAVAGKAAQSQRAVYVVPASVAQAGSARVADLSQTGVVLIDLDQGDIAAKRDHLVRHVGRPTLEVASGGITSEGQAKLHLYWRLTETAAGGDLSEVARLREVLATKVGGDPAFGRLHQPIRVAGTLHGKNGRLAAVRLLAHSQAEHDLRDLAEAIDAMPPLPSTDVELGAAGRAGPPARALATTKVREGGVDGITRFEALSRVMGHWIRTVRLGSCSLENAWQAVVEHNQALIDPPWEEDRLRDEFRRLCDLDLRNHGAMPVGEDSAGDISSVELPAAPVLSDDALAAAFVAAEGASWRHAPAWRTWFRWDGTCWVRDETSLVRDRMRHVCRQAARGAAPSMARRVASEKTIAAALKLAGTDPRIATAPAAWDAHPMLLNTRSGVLDLETGETRPHDPCLLMTQITAAGIGTACSRWLAFLDEITAGDRALQTYLQRLAGYCLAGTASEQIFAFLHGEGANGKSVFLGALAHVLGGYAATATLDTFAAARSGRHLTELAGLRAARLVLVPETEAGQGWAEARLKAVTGGEKIRANFMHQDHFEFEPQFTLIVAGNHRPTLYNVGEAMRRRLHLVPFTVTIPPERRDPNLPRTLIAERDGILGWMVEGCAAWQGTGLAPPPCVLEAGHEYFLSEDLAGQWIEERCVVGSQKSEQSAVLFQSWKSWSEDRGFPPGTSKSLGEALRARGFKNGKVRRGRGWYGLAVSPVPQGGEAGT